MHSVKCKRQKPSTFFRNVNNIVRRVKEWMLIKLIGSNHWSMEWSNLQAFQSFSSSNQLHNMVSAKLPCLKHISSFQTHRVVHSARCVCNRAVYLYDATVFFQKLLQLEECSFVPHETFNLARCLFDFISQRWHGSVNFIVESILKQPYITRHDSLNII